MKRLHVNLKVKELAESVRFYSTLFATEPTVTKPDYAKWMLDDPRVNFSIVEAPGVTTGTASSISGERSGDRIRGRPPSRSGRWYLVRKPLPPAGSRGSGRPACSG